MGVAKPNSEWIGALTGDVAPLLWEEGGKMHVVANKKAFHLIQDFFVAWAAVCLSDLSFSSLSKQWEAVLQLVCRSCEGSRFLAEEACRYFS